MGEYKEVDGDLITLALAGTFDVIAHGCNCFCIMGAGIAPQMAKAFACDRYQLESESWRGIYDKLGRIGFGAFYTKEGEEVRAYLVNKTNPLWIEDGWKKSYAVNCYSQYDLGTKDGKIPLDYEALTLCLRKINHQFAGMLIGLPQIGCGLAGGDWNVVKAIIKNELTECDVTVVIYNDPKQKEETWQQKQAPELDLGSLN